jgi:hypothetical protein
VNIVDPTGEFSLGGLLNDAIGAFTGTIAGIGTFLATGNPVAAIVAGVCSGAAVSSLLDYVEVNKLSISHVVLSGGRCIYSIVKLAKS